MLLNHMIGLLKMKNSALVPRRQWKKWPDIAQRIFNNTYYTMLENKHVMNHPKAKLNDEQWTTVCWNSAWISAESCVTALDDIIKEGK